MVATYRPRLRPSGASTSATCWASSRVGTRTSPRGLRGPRRTSAPSRLSSGRPKASVLPEPVAALPSTSRPASAAGSAEAWVANGVPMPARASLVTFDSGRASSAKLEVVRVATKANGHNKGGNYVADQRRVAWNNAPEAPDLHGCAHARTDRPGG